MRALPHTGKPTNLHFIYKDCKRKTFNNIFLQIYVYLTIRKRLFAYYATTSTSKCEVEFSIYRLPNIIVSIIRANRTYGYIKRVAP